MIFQTHFEQFLWDSKEPVEQADTDTRLQFAVTDTALVVFVVSQ